MDLTAVIAWLKAKAVYGVLILGVVYGAGTALHLWPTDDPTWGQIATIVSFLGFGAIRGKLSDLFAGVDLGPVGTWLTGKKTYIVTLIGVAFSILPLVGITVTPEVKTFINDLLYALGIGGLTSAVATYKLRALTVAEKLRLDGNDRGHAAVLSLFKKAA